MIQPAPRTGLLLGVLSAATFGLSGALGTSLLDAGWSPGSAIIARLTVASLVLTPFALASLRGSWRQLGRAAPMIAVYGVVAIAGCQVCYFTAISHLSVAVALLVEYLAAIVIVGWLWARHGRRPRRLTVAGSAAAIGGLVLVLDLASAHRVDPVGLPWAVAAMLCLVGYFLLSAGSRQQLPPLLLAWAGMCTGAVALAAVGAAGLMPIRAPRRDVELFSHRVSWIVPVLLLAVIATSVAYLAGIGAARLLGPKVSSFLGLSEVLFAVGFAWVALGQVPSAVQFAGGALMLAGVSLVRLDELREA